MQKDTHREKQRNFTSTSLLHKCPQQSWRAGAKAWSQEFNSLLPSAGIPSTRMGWKQKHNEGLNPGIPIWDVGNLSSVLTTVPDPAPTLNTLILIHLSPPVSYVQWVQLFLDCSCRRDQTLVVFLFLAYFTCHHVLQVHPYFTKW